MRAFNFSKALSLITGLVLLGSLAACGSALDGSEVGQTASTSNTAAIISSGNFTVNWGSPNYTANGEATTALSVVPASYAGATANFPTCFENNRACAHAAASVQQYIQNDPVLVQGFELNFTYSDQSEATGSTGSWSQVLVDAASVTTAEIRFNGTTGALAMGPSITKQLVTGATCNLGDADAVGYSSVTGAEQLLTGMSFYEEATYLSTGGSNSMSNAVLTAGRVWHSGLYPNGSNASFPFGFNFIPQSANTLSDIPTADFGINSFTATASTGIVVSPYFGLTSQADVPATGGYGNWLNHVVIGYCIEGRKIAPYASRPLLLYSAAYTRSPILQTLANTSN